MENSENITKTSELLVENDIRYPRKCRSSEKKGLKSQQFFIKEERNASLRTISAILQKSEEQRSSEETQILNDRPETVEEVRLRWKRRDEAKRRLEEVEEPDEELFEKCARMAQSMVQAQHLIVYTGAGISTAAKIPDYRGPNGIWTKLQQGKDVEKHDLSAAEPTFTHMALSQLYHQNILKYVVSQNCDGLHLRSGLPRFALSELHGNMLIEVCKTCTPHREYLRSFDVTENTARFSHKTKRKCHFCHSPLVDTIVHFGERGSLHWPLNWKGACKNARKATMILCLGSSLKVLKKYPWLWQMDKPVKKRPKLFIVNLQWTPKDDCATLKIHGKCDKVMKIVMNILGINVPNYDCIRDPVFYHLTDLCNKELHTTTRPFLRQNSSFKSEEDDKKEIAPVNLNAAMKFCLENAKIEPEICAFALKPPQNENGFFNFSNNFDFVRNSEIYFYPFLTSYMYSGLHSIITPSPILNTLKEQIDRNMIEEKNEVINFCKFCCREYRSPACLFYKKFIPSFNDNSNKIDNECLCCNDLSKNDDDKEESKDLDFLENSEIKNCNVLEKGQTKNKLGAGWFGKGYSKNRKRRKS